MLHALRDDFTMVVFPLGLVPVFAEKHDAPVMVVLFQQRLKMYDVDLAKVVSWTTDEGGAAPKIAELMKVTEIHCASHLLNTALSHAHRGVTLLFPLIGDVLATCKYFASMFNHSTQFKERLLATMLDTDGPIKGLVQHVVTRWNSLLNCMRSVQDAKPTLKRWAGQNALDPNAQSISNPRGPFWPLLEAMIYMYGLFEEAQVAMSADTTPTLHLVVFSFHDIIARLREYPIHLPKLEEHAAWPVVNPCCQSLVEHMIEALKSKLRPFDDAELIANALSPLHKCVNGASFADWNADLTKGYELISTEAAKIAAQAPAPDTDSDDEMEVEVVPDPRAKKGGLSAHFVNPAVNSVVDEMERLRTANLPKGMTVQVWWSNNCKSFPTLSILAHRIFCIPASSTSSERYFSAAGLIATRLRGIWTLTSWT